MWNDSKKGMFKISFEITNSISYILYLGSSDEKNKITILKLQINHEIIKELNIGLDVRSYNVAFIDVVRA
ncbi:hypothetical protein SMBr_10070 [Shewanella sp. M-Br]|nr:hypothetical protein SMBr_10070 [Shewanella sp. M-Br]